MSELLGLYALLRHFVESRVPQDRRIAAEVYNFHLVCKAVDIVLSVKKRRVSVRDGGRQLQAVLEQHLQSHVRTSGNGRVRPKTHCGFDIAECMQQDEMLLDCFMLERLHLRARGGASHCKRLDVYEESVMAGITNAHLNTLGSQGISTVALVGGTASLPGAPSITISDKCEYFGEFFQVDDFVIRGVEWCRRYHHTAQIYKQHASIQIYFMLNVIPLVEWVVW